MKTDARLSVVMECSKIGLMRIFGFQKDLKASRTMVMFVVLPDGLALFGVIFVVAAVFHHVLHVLLCPCSQLHYYRN